jgi:glucose-6-phosphate 1-dehydrogenase
MSKGSEPETGASAIVILGASGALASNRLFPAIRNLARRGLVPGQVYKVGVDLSPLPESLQGEGILMVQGNLRRKETYSNLARLLSTLGRRSAVECTFHLATDPRLFVRIVRGLQEEGLGRSKSLRRVLVEKPFGTSLRSSRRLEQGLGIAFARRQVYRVDHFLAKPGSRTILATRSANPRLESAWNREHVDQVQIIADERVGAEGRGRFYDGVGVMRDMVQSHLLQVLCLVAMELPTEDSPMDDSARENVLRHISLPRKSVVWGQYEGYRMADGVGRRSRTPTFTALRLEVDNRRWRGVPFYVRTGKKLSRDVTRVVVVFRQSVAAAVQGKVRKLDMLSFEIDPRPGVRLGLARGTSEALPVVSEPRGKIRGKNEYETLLYNALHDDHSLFVGARFNGLAWKIVDPPIRELSSGRMPLNAYEAGTGGPGEADSLIKADGRAWC